MTVGPPLKPRKPPGEADTGELLAQVEDDRHCTEAGSVTEPKREIISDWCSQAAKRASLDYFLQATKSRRVGGGVT